MNQKNIHKRYGHVGVSYKNIMIIWGGGFNTEDGMQSHKSNELMVYDPLTEIWVQIIASGEIPSATFGACAVVADHFLYIFGGWSGHDSSNAYYNNDLYRLDLLTYTWIRLHPAGTQPNKCDKLAGWAYNEKLYFFGGFGLVPERMQRCRCEYWLYDDAYPEWHSLQRCWNNQLVCYDRETDAWEWPTTVGPRPSPRAAHTGALCPTGRAYVFGGRHGNTRDNQLHCLHLDTMTWSGDLMLDRPSTSVPEGRSWHSFTFIDNRHAVVYGGLNSAAKVLDDCWQLCLDDMSWKQMNWLKDCWPSKWHTAVYCHLTNELIINGGSKTYEWLQPDYRKQLMTINFSPKSLYRLCLDAICMDEIDSDDWESLPKTLQFVIDQRREQIAH